VRRTPFRKHDISGENDAEAAARKEQRRMEGKQRAKEITISHQKSNANASTGPTPERKRHGARNQRRHKNFTKCLLEFFPHICRESIAREESDNLNAAEAHSTSIVGMQVLDVAGGKGELAARLSICHKLKVVLVDPREADVTKCYDDCAFKTIPKKNSRTSD
jgi:2-polyprenyl-3-methyl-5-hydroxy-6-metoxy-1,4-benzoquinol methylase